MNWGKGIAVVMVTFITFITIMIVGFMSHGVDLEDNDYYQKEIAYEDEITRLNNVNQLNNKPEINITDSHVTVQFKGDEEYDNIQLLLKRPNNETEDEYFEINDTKFFSVSRKELRQGKYNIELKFNSAGKEYLHKESIYIE